MTAKLEFSTALMKKIVWCMMCCITFSSLSFTTTSHFKHRNVNEVKNSRVVALFKFNPITMSSVLDSLDHIFKILLIGDAGVGKSSILLQFTDNCFDSNLQSTIGMSNRVKYS
jgi:putative ribosome biogenesis GTPase RsgA